MANKYPGKSPIFSYPFTDESIATFVSGELPHWKKACDDPEVDPLFFHPEDFGNTLEDFLHIALAIKYAMAKRKTIMIEPKE